MLKPVFRDLPLLEMGASEYPDFQYVQKGLADNIRKMTRYQRKNNRSVESSHLLYQLVRHLSIPFGKDVKIYADSVRDVAYDLANQFQLNSAVEMGEPKHGVFFHEDLLEFCTVKVGDLSDVELVGENINNWQELCPLRVLYHPYDDITVRVPDGTWKKRKGYAAVEIDIVKLAVMYRQWKKELDAEDTTSDRQFIYRYVLTNALTDCMRIAVFNRMHTIAVGKTPTQFEVITSPAMIDYTRRADNELYIITQQIFDFKVFDWKWALEAIPLMEGETLRSMNFIPDGLISQQNSWVMHLTILPLLQFLGHMGLMKTDSVNRMYTNRVQKTFKSLKANQTFKNSIKVDEYRLIQEEILFLSTLLSVRF